MKNIYKSLLFIEEIMAIVNDRNDHLCIELLDKKEYIYITIK
jgi:hypothetical protein